MPEDQQIIKLYKSGQTIAMEMLIERHKDSLYKFCYHLAGNRFDADDIFQDTWARVIHNIDTYDDKKAFCNWLYSVALNVYRDRYRKAKRWLSKVRDYFSNDEKDAEMSNVRDDRPMPEELAAGNELRTELKECIESLDESFRLPIILFYFKELSYEDISQVLGIPSGTVKSRLNAGKAKLKRMMEVRYHE